jgi:hypothetical protein
MLSCQCDHCPVWFVNLQEADIPMKSPLGKNWVLKDSQELGS